jgi:hypothetical protein
VRALASSPSGGQFEVLHALYAARGHDGNYVPDWHVRRRFPKRTTLTEVQTVLAAISSTYVQTDGSGNWTLTAAGVAYARANRPRRWISVAC